MESMLSSLLQQLPPGMAGPPAPGAADPDPDLLLRQQQTQQQIQALLNQSSALLSCGPECQKQRDLDRLQQQYLDAEANAQAAPAQLETARRRWVIASKGRTAYDAERVAALQKEAEERGARLQTQFQRLLAAADTACASYSLAVSQHAHAAELLRAVQKENGETRRETRDLRDETVTNDSRAWYETQSLQTALAWGWVMLVAYYLAWAWAATRFASVLLHGGFGATGGVRSGLLGVLAATYPFWIMPLARWARWLAGQVRQYLYLPRV